MLSVLAWALACLPWRALTPLGRALGWLVGVVWRVRRDQVERAMVRAGLPAPAHTALGMYRSLGVGLFELFWVLGRPRRTLSTVASIGPELTGLLAGADDHPQGMVLATAHTGNWDLSACVLARRGIPLTIVSKRLSVRWLDGFWQSARAGEGIELVHGTGTFARIADALGRRRHVALIIDQAPERASAVCTTTFLGALAQSDLTPALLAARSGATLALVLGHRTVDGTHVVECQRSWTPPPRATRAWAEQTTGEMQAELAAFVRAHPEQWLWLHRRWKGTVPQSEGRARRLTASPPAPRRPDEASSAPRRPDEASSAPRRPDQPSPAAAGAAGLAAHLPDPAGSRLSP